MFSRKRRYNLRHLGKRITYKIGFKLTPVIFFKKIYVQPRNCNINFFVFPNVHSSSVTGTIIFSSNEDKDDDASDSFPSARQQELVEFNLVAFSNAPKSLLIELLLLPVQVQIPVPVPVSVSFNFCLIFPGNDAIET